MRTTTACTVLTLILGIGAARLRADEVVLTTGFVLRGTVEKETPERIVLRTRSGRVTLARSLVREIRRTGEGPEEPQVERRSARIRTRVPGVLSDVAPALAGKMAILALRDGGIAAMNLSGPESRWRAPLEGARVTGLSADPGGVYVATAEGDVARLDPRSGYVLWVARIEVPIAGPPLRLPRRVLVLSPGIGLVALDAATGREVGRLAEDFEPDTPLAADGARVLVGTRSGRLLVIGNQGATFLSSHETSSPWFGSPLALSAHSVFLGGGERLVVLSLTRGTAGPALSVPGLIRHPLAAESPRVFCDVGGTLTAVTLPGGRPVWRAAEIGRVTQLTPTPEGLLVTASDGFLGLLARADGSTLWTTDLGARASSAPLAAKDRILVVTERGEALLLAVEGDDTKPGEAGSSAPPAPLAPPTPRVIHSPDGYSVVVPAGWGVTEQVNRGPASLGLQPLAGAPSLRVEGATELGRRRLLLRGRVTVTVLPSQEESRADLALLYLTDEQIRARNGGLRVESPKIHERRIGDREWTEIGMAATMAGFGGEVRLVRRALIGRLDGKRAVRIELVSPRTFAAVTGRDLETIAGSFTPEPPGAFTPPAETGVAADFLEALESGDLPAVRAHLSEPQKDVTELPDLEDALFRLVDLDSRPKGAFREVLVRVDRADTTRLATLTLGREGDRWVVMDWRGLLR